MKNTIVIFIICSFFAGCISEKKLAKKIVEYQADQLIHKNDTIWFYNDSIAINSQKKIKNVNNDSIEEDKIFVEFVGNSEIQKAMAENTNIPANAGLGVRFTKEYSRPTNEFNINKFEIDLSISIASTVDTIVATRNTGVDIDNVNEFGNSILSPVNSGQSVVFNIKAYMNEQRPILGKNWGMEGKIYASNRVWKLEQESQNISTISLSLGPFSEFVPVKKYKDFSISIGGALSTRCIFGNVGQESKTDFRNAIISTDNTWFFGSEFNFTIRLKDIKATASFPILYSSDEVPGLTNGQFLTTIRFTGGFPLSLGGN